MRKWVVDGKCSFKSCSFVAVQLISDYGNRLFWKKKFFFHHTFILKQLLDINRLKHMYVPGFINIQIIGFSLECSCQKLHLQPRRDVNCSRKFFIGFSLSSTPVLLKIRHSTPRAPSPPSARCTFVPTCLACDGVTFYCILFMTLEKCWLQLKIGLVLLVAEESRRAFVPPISLQTNEPTGPRTEYSGWKSWE